MISAGTNLGAYTVVGPLGSGGMGEVYRAHDARLGRDVALKVLPKDLALDPTRRGRFEQEARHVASLNHPNIVALFDIGVEGERAYMITELIEGASLRGMNPPSREVVLGLDRRTIDVLDVETGGLKRSITFDIPPDDKIEGFAFNSTGQRVLLVTGGDRNDLWMVEGYAQPASSLRRWLGHWESPPPR